MASRWPDGRFQIKLFPGIRINFDNFLLNPSFRIPVNSRINCNYNSELLELLELVFKLMQVDNAINFPNPNPNPDIEEEGIAVVKKIRFLQLIRSG